MIRWKQEPEMVAYMMEIIPGHEEGEIRAMFLEKFGIVLTKMQIKNFKINYNIRSGTHGGRFKKGQVPMNKGKKMSPEVYEKSKKTMFHKGHIPVNHRPVGSERINIYGYTEIKVAEPNKWKLKQRFIYEEATGEKLTKNDAVIFLDGNRQNFDISNLVKMTRVELLRYNRDHLYGEEVEINETAVLVAKLKAKMGEARDGANR